MRTLLKDYPAVALLGPRQVGKTTLAHEIAKNVDSVYLDLESTTDRAKLAKAELYLADHEERLVILDEVHRVPDRRAWRFSAKPKEALRDQPPRVNRQFRQLMQYAG